MIAAENVKYKEPHLELFRPHPIWWHHHGTKMVVREINGPAGRILISGSAATVNIRPWKEVPEDSHGWAVEWEITHTLDCAVRGRSYFSSDELAAAFCLTDDSGHYGQWLIDQFGARSAEQGKYIRWDDFLNIPCPGTGHDGDPNVSIKIDQEMRDAIKRLLRR